MKSKTEVKHTPGEAFYYEPDFRSKVHPRDPKKPFCCRCQQNVDPSKAIPVSVNDESWMAIEGHGRHEEIRTNFNPQAKRLVYDGYIGRDCRAAISKARSA